MAKKVHKKVTKKQKPTYVVIDGVKIVTNFPWKGLKKDYYAFIEANTDAKYVGYAGIWCGADIQLYECGLARGMALRTDSGASRKAKRARNAQKRN